MMHLEDMIEELPLAPETRQCLGRRVRAKHTTEALILAALSGQMALEQERPAEVDSTPASAVVHDCAVDLVAAGGFVGLDFAFEAAAAAAADPVAVLEEEAAVCGAGDDLHGFGVLVYLGEVGGGAEAEVGVFVGGESILRDVAGGWGCKRNAGCHVWTVAGTSAGAVAVEELVGGTA